MKRMETSLRPQAGLHGTTFVACGMRHLTGRVWQGACSTRWHSVNFSATYHLCGWPHGFCIGHGATLVACSRHLSTNQMAGKVEIAALYGGNLPPRGRNALACAVYAQIRCCYWRIKASWIYHAGIYEFIYTANTGTTHVCGIWRMQSTRTPLKSNIIWRKSLHNWELIPSRLRTNKSYYLLEKSLKVTLPSLFFDETWWDC